MKTRLTFRRVTALTLSLPFMLLGAAANALVVPPSVFPTGTTVAARPELAGVVLADVIRPFSFTISGAGGTVLIEGEIQDRVVRSDLDGTLDFYWRIFNQSTASPGVTPALYDLSFRNGFDGFTTDVDYRLDGLGDLGFVLGDRAGDSVVFSSSDFATIGPGDSSYFWFVKTNATAFDESGSGSLTGVDFDGRDPQGVGIIPVLFAPAEAPEPSSGFLLLSGLAGLILGLAKRRSAQAGSHSGSA